MMQKNPIRVAAALLAVAMAWPVAAQQPGGSSSAVLRGEVVDEQTGAPLSGVVVEVAPHGQKVATDEAGAFRLSVRAGRDYMLTFSRLGYEEQRTAVSIPAGGALEPMTFAMTPEPLVLEAVEVLVDRFEDLRHRVPVSSYVLRRDYLARSGGSNLAQVVRSSAMLMTTSCAGASTRRSFAGFGASPIPGMYCIRYRGDVVIPTVYIDDRPAFGGVDELATYSPWDVHHVEIYQRGLTISVYTMAYVDNLARGNRRLPLLHPYW
jgi:hypothetical protein